MNYNTGIGKASALWLAGAVLCCAALTAEGQRNGRPNRGQSTFANGSRSTSNATSGTSASGMAGMNCPQNGTGSTGTTASQANTGTTIQTFTGRAANQQSQAQQSAQTNGSLSALTNASNQALVQWAGNTSNIRRITLAVFSADGQMVDSRVITQMPVQAVFNLNSGAAVYGAQIEYSNGTRSVRYASFR